MTDNSMLPPTGGPGSPATAAATPGPSTGRALLWAAIIIAAGVVAGFAGGLIWSAVAPRVLYQMYSLNPPTAYAVNPETSAFIAADGWYCLIALAGGALLGLLGYFFGVRRYGPLPMVATVGGAIAAAFIAQWLGHQQSGGPGFDHLLATSKPGAFLHAPVSLGSHGALAFWPLAAAAVAGGLELFGVMRSRRQPLPGVPMPGLDSFGHQSRWAGPVPGAPPAPPPPDRPWLGEPVQGGSEQLHRQPGDGDSGVPER
jgi:hypothetical protein